MSEKKEILNEIENKTDINNIVETETETETEMEINEDKPLDAKDSIENKINASKMYSDIRNAADTYFIEETKSKTTFKNIGKPLFKIALALIFSFLLVTFLQEKISINNKYSNIYGLWEDEYKNYYEIYGKTFEMNAGDPDVPFYEGTITNVIENDKGYTILVEGIKYTLNNDGTTTYDKKLDIVFKITNYSEEVETIMTANMGTEDFDIVRIDKALKENR